MSKLRVLYILCIHATQTVPKAEKSKNAPDGVMLL